MLYPITFSIPEEKIVNSIPEKTKMLSSLIPGVLETYIYNDEESYYNEYRQSLFVMTKKKSGWDCMRHYEIMACGAIPYFPDIEKCPSNTMALLPKDLFIEGNELYNKIGNKSMTDLTSDELDETNDLINKLLEYTHTHLTTRKMAKYILEKTNYNHVSNILFLSGKTTADYLRCLTLHGFKQHIGSQCHDYPVIPHIYKTDYIPYHKLYGKGITFTNLLDPLLHNDILDHTLEEDIKNKKYDIVIYGSYHRGMPYYEWVSSIYNPNEIIMLCGEDIHDCDYYKWVEKGHHVFVREL
jgi:hypothetical protein